jgi:hypothetical protein
MKIDIAAHQETGGSALLRQLKKKGVSHFSLKK